MCDKTPVPKYMCDKTHICVTTSKSVFPSEQRAAGENFGILSLTNELQNCSQTVFLIKKAQHFLKFSYVLPRFMCDKYMCDKTPVPKYMCDSTRVTHILCVTKKLWRHPPVRTMDEAEFVEEASEQLMGGYWNEKKQFFLIHCVPVPSHELLWCFLHEFGLIPWCGRGGSCS